MFDHLRRDKFCKNLQKVYKFCFRIYMNFLGMYREQTKFQLIIENNDLKSLRKNFLSFFYNDKIQWNSLQKVFWISLKRKNIE